MTAIGARNLTWYHMFDSRGMVDGVDTRRMNDSEDWFGLVWRRGPNDWVKKGGFWGYALCSRFIPGKTYKPLTYPDPLPTFFESFYFEGTDGSRTLVAWNNHRLSDREVRVITEGRNHKAWCVVTGESKSVNATSVHKLNAVNNTSLPTLMILTWEE